MRDIPIGTKGTDTLLVKPEHTANQFKDAILPQVFATPMMVRLMENAALNAIRPYLEPGESAVGTAIDMQHLAATPVGGVAVVTAELEHQDGRLVRFAVSAVDRGGRLIATGEVTRVIVERERFAARIPSP